MPLGPQVHCLVEASPCQQSGLLPMKADLDFAGSPAGETNTEALRVAPLVDQQATSAGNLLNTKRGSQPFRDMALGRRRLIPHVEECQAVCAPRRRESG